MLYAFAVATILIALAELGDKTQLLALALATRYRVWQVLLGIFVATLAVHLLSTVAGELVGRLIPRLALRVVSGVLFVGFGVWTLRGEEDTDAESVTAAARYGPVVTTGIAFFIAELGDKTQIMTMTIAADPAAVLRTLGSAGPSLAHVLSGAGLSAAGLTRAQAFWGVWMGSTLGMMIADGAAIAVGAVLGRSLPQRSITRISGVLFILFGLAAIVVAATGRS